MAVADQVFGDIERRYSLEAIQSMPVSATMMAPGLLLAPAAQVVWSVAAAFAFDPQSPRLSQRPRWLGPTGTTKPCLTT